MAKVTSAEKVTDLARNTIDKLITAMENDPGNWVKPWRSALSAGPPTNIVTNSIYNGSNFFTLSLSAMEQGFTSNLWGTYKQWQAKGFQVQSGQKGTGGILVKKLAIDGDGNRVKGDGDSADDIRFISMLRTFTLFNADQTDCVTDTEPPPPPKTGALTRMADGLFAQNGIVVQSGPQASYRPSTDIVTLPDRADFTSDGGYFMTALHEASHWTGHGTRLARDGITGTHPFGSDGYAREELTVELAAMIVSAQLGIDTADFDEGHEHTANSAAYLVNWLRGEKPNTIWTVASQAQASADWLTSRSVSESDQTITTGDTKVIEVAVQI